MEPGYPSAAEPSVEVTLFVGYPKQDKLEQVIRHGVEPVSYTHLDVYKRQPFIRHWRRLLLLLLIVGPLAYRESLHGLTKHRR